MEITIPQPPFRRFQDQIIVKIHKLIKSKKIKRNIAVKNF